MAVTPATLLRHLAADPKLRKLAAHVRDCDACGVDADGAIAYCPAARKLAMRSAAPSVLGRLAGFVAAQTAAACTHETVLWDGALPVCADCGRTLNPLVVRR